MKYLIFLLFCVSFLPAFAINLSAERAADLALADAKHFDSDSNGLMIFIGNSSKENGIIRLSLEGCPVESRDKGIPFAIYEIEEKTGKILRRDFLKKVRSNWVTEGKRSGGISIHGVLRNIPGYILQGSNFSSQFLIWAESGGKVISTDTELIGTTVYHLKGIPVTAGTIAIKAKIRGYDLVTLHPGVVLNPAQPVGVIGGIDVDFHQITPITRDVRFLLIGTPAGAQDGGSLPPGTRARVIVKETGQAADGISSNSFAEIVIQAVPTGWPLNFIGLNMDAGYYSGVAGPLIIPENGNSMYTETIRIN